MGSFFAGLVVVALLAGGTFLLYDYASVDSAEGFAPNPAVHVEPTTGPGRGDEGT